MIDAAASAREHDRRPGRAGDGVGAERAAAVADDVDRDRCDPGVRKRRDDGPRPATYVIEPPIVPPAAGARSRRGEDERDGADGPIDVVAVPRTIASTKSTVADAFVEGVEGRRPLGNGKSELAA
jgi:hypothetical protein